MKSVPQAIAVSRLAASRPLRQAKSLAQMHLGAPRDFASL
jgi:hypothetical protein